MYIRTNDQNQQAGLRGFSDSPPLDERQKSLDALLRALQLNPVGGYVIGSLARKRLEDAINIVPLTSALEICNQLSKGEGPLGRLFQYRLHKVTKDAMLHILWGKH